MVFSQGFTVQLKNADTKDVGEEKGTALVEVKEMVCKFGSTSTITISGSRIRLKG